MSFTPGPWSKHGSVIRAIGINDKKVADVLVRDDEGQSNARLIAAAPELLEALEKLVLFTNPKPSNSVALNYAHQVIAKARGEGV